MQNTFGKAAAIATSVAMALGTFGFAAPAFAAVNSTHITILTQNRGVITNTTQADSHTGQNLALGSQGGSGGNGGNITAGNATSTGSENNGGASAGNGGNGGNGGGGGWIDTGDASAEAGTENSLNGTDAAVEFDCACGDLNSVTVDLTTDNDDEHNVITNTTRADARSGANEARGSIGGNAGNGGLVDSGSGNENNGGATSGTGGNGGSGGLGGTVITGSASSTSGTVNLLNTTILRVRM